MSKKYSYVRVNLIVFAIIALLTGCGGGGGDAPAQTPTPTDSLTWDQGSWQEKNWN